MEPLASNDKGEVIRWDGEGTEFDQAGVVRGVQGEDRCALGQGVPAQRFGFAVRFGVGDEEAVGQGGDMGVALGGQGRGGAADVAVEKRKEQQAAFGYGRLPAFRRSHVIESPGRADDGRRAPQQHVQAFFFHRRLKPADDRHVGMAQRLGQVVSFENRVAGGAYGTKEPEQRSIKHAEVAPSCDRRRAFILGTPMEHRRVVRGIWA